MPVPEESTRVVPGALVGPPVLDEGRASLRSLTFTVAVLGSTVPSLALKVNESAPVAPALRV